MAIGILVGILSFFVWVIGRVYFVRASSDPHNWLVYAHHFGREVLTSRWPYGFPLFLRLLLPLTGPYWIFLVNLPLLVIVFLLLWMLSAAGDETPATSLPSAAPGSDARVGRHGGYLAGLAAVAMAISADAGELVQYVNPYRDPFSYSLLFLALWVFVRALALRRVVMLSISGALLGFACSVREPSILMLVPMLIYGVVEWRRAEGKLSLWKSVGGFGLGFILALVPFAVQTYLATNQLLLPPQAAKQARVVPGAHFRWAVLQNVSTKAWEHYQQQIWIPALAFIGLLAAIGRRQRIVLFLVAPACLVYAFFYGFYKMFVPRYFYIVTLLLCLAGGYGTAWLLQAGSRLFPRRWREHMALGGIVCLCMLSAGRLWRAQNHGRRPFQVPDARAFAEALGPMIPEDAVVFSQRNLCELIQVVVLRESYAWAFLPEMIADRVESLWAAGRPVYAMEVPSGRYVHGDTIHLRRTYDLERMATFNPDDYNLRSFAAGPFFLHKVRRLSQRRAAGTIETRGWNSGPVWLAVDTGYLDAISPGRQIANVSINGNYAANAVEWSGANLLEFSQGQEERPDRINLEIVSDGYLPVEVRMAGGDLATPIELDFDLHSLFDHRWRWSGGVQPPNLRFRKQRLLDDATCLVPVVFPRAGRVVLEWHFSSVLSGQRTPEHLFFYEDDHLIGECVFPADFQPHAVFIALPEVEEARERRIRIVRRQTFPGNPYDSVDVHRLILHRPTVARLSDIRVGGLEDGLYILKGFHHREGEREKAPFRWTDGRGELRLFGSGNGRDRHLRIHYSVAHVPPAARAASLAVYWNGQERTPVEVETEADGLERVVTVRIPAADVRDENRVALVSPPWVPREHGIPDTRLLGVMLRRVEIEEDSGGVP